MDKLKSEKLDILKGKNFMAKMAVPILLILNLVIFSFLIFKSVGFFWIWSRERITLAVQNEQSEHKDNLLALIASIENQTDSLEAEYKNVSSKNAIGLEKKKEILEKLGELEKDGQQLTIEFNAYYRDESIKINPWHDLRTDETFNKSWLLPNRIERLARSFSFGIFRGFITFDQKKIIEKDLSGIRYQIDEIKKTWR